MRVIRKPSLPHGLSRKLFRFPIYVYRARLGWLFGERLLLLTHRGRVSGQERHVVLEVVEHDRRDGSYVVASGWGTGAAWYQNILRTPNVVIQIRNRKIQATAVQLSTADGAEIFANYAGRHRVAARFMLPRVLGFAVDGSDADFRAVGRQIPFVRFVPRI
ncbi:deazaflavin-dependent oxidoreductase, nitroreductase family [Mycolicibacterium rutilum]|uniref:Deazaflavin-dependent oxidoreductase, nitroreductase family n=1 Tax=Mycolicibacterium rutilum TaxID=370526 RepID=A0A1H6KSF5_MYCRU|nr:nitroreductase family deazaflavin-dependent oxidoreductase [Mycolicibacterium rutilum]SEH75837.1 deazaflavin-dependent oxidoreductase, nitroreductase family [Mycolicibacterium rutilum]